MKLRLLATVATIGLVGALGAPQAKAQAAAAPAPAAPAAPAAPTSNAMATPSMGPTLAANPNPVSIDLSDANIPYFGKQYITAQFTGLGFWQSNAVPPVLGVNPPTLPHGFQGNTTTEADVSNAMAEVQKTDGLVQYYVQAGAYTFPTVGSAYIDAADANSAYFGAVPVVYGKIVPTDSLSFQIGKLPTLIGQESVFTFQNINIERGLLWAQENIINRGIQGNYTTGPWAFALSLNDGFYTDNFTYITGSVTYTMDSANTFVLAGGGNAGRYTHVNPVTGLANVASPEPAANEQQYDLSWTYTNGPWTINPWIQYTHTPSITVPVTGHINSGATYGAALLVAYTFDPSQTFGIAGFSLGGRAEYIDSTGSTTTPGSGPNLLGYGPGSKAWSLTLTPTYQYKLVFIRGEVSYVQASNVAPGFGFGGEAKPPTGGTATTQARGLVELGFLF
jgi:hypothetical protein